MLAVAADATASVPPDLKAYRFRWSTRRIRNGKLFTKLKKHLTEERSSDASNSRLITRDVLKNRATTLADLRVAAGSEM